jgi:glycosyltransferase involved in cell wall biosynthesis
MLPLVSVVIPYYNDGKYIHETLESIQHQTYKNVEIILVDDGSTEKESIRVFDDLKKIGFQTYRQKNAGPSAARNLGISHSRGKYILPVDADDKIRPIYIEKAVHYMESHTQCGIVYCKAEFFGARSGLWNLPKYSIEQMLLNNCIFVSALFKRTDWETVHGYDSNMKYGLEDYEFWLSIIELGQGVYCIPEVLFLYRIKSVSRNTRFEKRGEVYAETYEYILRKHMKLYTRYWIDVILMLRNENYELRKRYNKLVNKIPFYTLFKGLSSKKKQKVKNLLGL